MKSLNILSFWLHHVSQMASIFLAARHLTCSPRNARDMRQSWYEPLRHKSDEKISCLGYFSAIIILRQLVTGILIKTITQISLKNNQDFSWKYTPEDEHGT